MAYNAMKAALITYSKQLSQHVGKKGVRVNAVSPGPDLFRGRRLGDDQGHDAQDVRLGDEADSPAAAWAPPRRSRASWPSSRARPARLVTGANVVADNGFTKRVQF